MPLSVRQLHRVVEKTLLFGPKQNQAVIGPEMINEAHKQAMPLFLCFFNDGFIRPFAFDLFPFYDSKSIH